MITILVPNQTVKLKWTGCIKSHYVEKGYVFTKLFDEFEVKAEDLTSGSNAKVQCRCDYCGKIKTIKYITYSRQINDGTGKYACKKCVHEKLKEMNNGVHPSVNWKKRTLDGKQVIEIVESKNNNILLNPEEYINYKTKNLKIVCGSCGGEFITSLSSIVNGDGNCPACGKKKSDDSRRFSKSYVEEFINSINGNVLLNPDEYISFNNANLKIRCGKCGNIYTTSFGKYKNENQITCPQCSRKQSGINKRLKTDQLREKIESINNNILLNPEDYQNYRVRNLKIKCGECGRIFITSLENYQSGKIRCSHCSRSKTEGERLVENYLKKYNIEYVMQMKFEDCRDKRPLPFDFYLPTLNVCIEFDGQQHFEPKYGQEAFEITQKHDQIKNDYCKKNDIKMIRIPYWKGHKIEEILTKELHI